MPTIHLHLDNRVDAGAVNCRAHRLRTRSREAFGNSTDDYLKVHGRSSSQADVTEGSNGIRERLHYDWSNPNHVVLTTTDSNVWGGALLGLVVGTIGRGVLEKAFRNSVKTIEARNGVPTKTAAS
jgi:hypothetical protein